MFRSAHAACASGITHERCANLRHRKKKKKKKPRNGAHLKLRLAYGRRSKNDFNIRFYNCSVLVCTINSLTSFTRTIFGLLRANIKVRFATFANIDGCKNNLAVQLSLVPRRFLVQLKFHQLIQCHICRSVTDAEAGATSSTSRLFDALSWNLVNSAYLSTRQCGQLTQLGEVLSWRWRCQTVI